MKTLELSLDPARIRPELDGDWLHSLGTVEIDGTVLRHAATRWLPWFDTFEGSVFSRFRFEGIERRGATQVIRTTALCDNDYPFRERRDCSGDLCFRNANWDAKPTEAQLDICFEPVHQAIDGRAFTGFKYWFEYSGDVPIHRIVDRQTWEVGGNLDDVTPCLRNWLTPPRMRLPATPSTSLSGSTTGVLCYRATCGRAQAFARLRVLMWQGGCPARLLR